jgi:DNA polymerase
MDPFQELLEATISQLQDLKRQGRRFVPVSGDTLNALATLQPEKPALITAPIKRNPTPPAPVLSRPVPPPVTESPPEPITPALTGKDKIDAFAKLRERAMVCQKCPNLAASRKSVVFGVGNIDAELMFVGEAPGADEDIQGEPFVGRAGETLTKMIGAMGLTREQVYIANILKCRPDTPGQTSGNRPPTPEEMDRCLPYLHAQIDLIRPKVIVTLGATAVDGLFGKIPGVGITRARGKWRQYRGIPVMPTYHPSYLLRPNINNIKREAWEDLLQVMDRLQLPISEKQRGFFLKPPAAPAA